MDQEPRRPQAPEPEAGAPPAASRQGIAIDRFVLPLQVVACVTAAVLLRGAGFKKGNSFLLGLVAGLIGVWVLKVTVMAIIDFCSNDE